MSNYNNALLHSSAPLKIYIPSEPRLIPEEPSCIPAVRSGIRQQTKLLRSVSNTVLLLGIISEALLCFCMEPCSEVLGTLGSVAMCISGFAIALVSLFVWTAIRMSISEIKEELKKLNGEV